MDCTLFLSVVLRDESLVLERYGGRRAGIRLLPECIMCPVQPSADAGKGGDAERLFCSSTQTFIVHWRLRLSLRFALVALRLGG